MMLRKLQAAALRQARRERDFSRGTFIKSAAAASGMLLAGCATAAPPRSQRERLVIVGAGIAGLTAARILADAGIAAAVYDSANRIGGRMHSETRYWDEGQHTEWCGAMIDSSHHTMHALARRFGVPLLDTVSSWPKGARDTAYLDRRYYPMAQADRDFAAIYPVLQRQLHAVGPSTTYNNATPFARELDRISIAAWIERFVPGGLHSQLGRLIKEAYRNEYGREIEELSALNVVYQLGVQENYHGTGQLNVLGYSDQRFTSATGNQSIPERIAASLPAGSIALGQRLLAIAKRPAGNYDLRFSASDGTLSSVQADRLILAIPFIALRGVDYASAGFDARKKNAIENLGYGYHTKVHMQFTRRAWEEHAGWPYPVTGQIWTDLDFQCSTDFSLGQRGRSGILEQFTGPPAGMRDLPLTPYAKISDSRAVRHHVRSFLAQLDSIWPGVSRYWNGKATMGDAQADPNILASYSSWLVGQYTTIAGYESVRQGRIHFAGEHTSVDYQGFMEGGAKSGVDVAREILGERS
jgi:monoamine oxidase